MKRFLKKIKNMSLLYKIVLSYLIIIFIPISIFSYMYYTQAVDKIQDKYKNSMKNQTVLLTNNVQNKINQLSLSARTISRNQYLLNYLKNYHKDPAKYFMQIYMDLGDYINNINTVNSDIHSVRIYTNYIESDIPILRYRNIIYDKEFFLDNPSYEAVNSLGVEQFFLEDMHIYEEIDFLKPGGTTSTLGNPAYVFSLYKKIYSQSINTFIGILELNITEEVLFKSLISDDNEFYIFLMNRNGEFVQLSNKESGNIFSKEVLIDASNSGDVYFEDEKYMAYSENIETINTRLIIMAPYENFSLEKKSFVFTFFIIIIFSLLALFFILTVIYKIIFKRMDILVENMQKVQKGNFDVKIQIDQTDEIGQIKMTFNVMINKINNLINTVYKTQLAEKEATLSYLQSQINPHFLFNTLEAIRMASDMKGNYEVSNALFSLSRILSVRIKPNRFINIHEEIDVIKNFISIENLRHNNKVVFEDKVDNRLVDYKIPALILQPIAENSIVHGFKSKKTDCVLKFHATLTDDNKVKFEIIDNGSGMTEEKLQGIKKMLLNDITGGKFSDINKVDSSSNSIGIINISNRIHLYYGNEYGLDMENIGTGLKTTVLLPWKKNGKLPSPEIS